MDREDRREPWTSELLDDVDDTRFIGSLADQPAEIRCMKLPVGARCGPDLVMKHLRILVSRALRYQPRCGCLRHAGRTGPPSAHEPEQEASRNTGIAACTVEGKKSLPDRLRVDVPAGQCRLRRLDQLGPACSDHIGRCTDVDMSGEYSFVRIFSTVASGGQRRKTVLHPLMQIQWGANLTKGEGMGCGAWADCPPVRVPTQRVRRQPTRAVVGRLGLIPCGPGKWWAGTHPTITL